MATETNVKKLNIHKLKKKTYNTLAEKPAGDIFLLTDVGGQVKEITEASADYVGEIVQYVGATNDTYTNGYFYKCTETDGVYSWVQVNVQEGGLEVSEYGGNSLVAGFTYDKYMHKTTAFGKKITLPDNTSSNALFGSEINMKGAGSVGFGYNITGGSVNNTVVGSATLTYNVTNSVIIGQHSASDPISESRSVVFASFNNAYKILDLTDGTIPAERMSATAGTTGQVLTKTDAGMEWQDATGGGELPDNVLVNNATVAGGIAIGNNSSASQATAVSIGSGAGKNSGSNINSVAIGTNAQAGYFHSIAIGGETKINLASYAIQLGKGTNSKSSTFCVGNQTGNYEMMSADGTIPTDRYTTTPTDAGTYVPKLTIAEDGTTTREWGAESGGASGDYLPLSGGTLTGDLCFGGNTAWYGKIGQVTDMTSGLLNALGFYAASSQTPQWVLQVSNGNFVPFYDNSYSIGSEQRKAKTVYTTKLNNGADLAVPTEGGTLARLEDIQIAGGLPAQTDNAGKFLTTDGTTASWSQNIILTDNNISTPYYGVTLVGRLSVAKDSYSTVVGFRASAKYNAVALGHFAQADASNSIQLGNGTNSDVNTFKVGNANGNFELMDANGNVPLDRLTYITDQIGDISTALTAILGE